MLDDPNVVKQRDPQDALGFAAKQPEQLAHNFGLATQDVTTRPTTAIVFAGMGGSSLVAELVHTWPRLKLPYVVWKNYGLPDFVNEKTLVICASYSGNTEETLSSVAEAEKRGATIAVMAHGGKLLELAKSKGYVLAELPACPQPRAGVLYGYRALVEILVAAKLVAAESIAELQALVSPLEKAISQWTPDMPKGHNIAKQIAEHMVGKTPIIYAGPLMYPAAFKWKINVNENAKNTAWSSPLPEFNHNEMIGWSSHPVEKPFAVIDLRSSFEHPRVQERFDVTDRILSGLRPKALRLDAQGSSALEHMLYLIMLGDFATMYMGLLNGVNPTPVVLVEKFKKELG